MQWSAVRSLSPASSFATLPASPYPPPDADLQIIRGEFEQSFYRPLMARLEKTQDWGLTSTFLTSREPRCGRCKIGELDF